MSGGMDVRSETTAVDGEEDDLLLQLRRLEISDNGKGFVELLSQLSPATGPLSNADFRARFADLAALGDDHLIVVAEDRHTGRIVATGSVFIERKFLRGGGKVGHIEDVVVDAAAALGSGWFVTFRTTPGPLAATRSPSIARPI
ncbi:unnamed protein product [Musa textilis]